VVTVYADQVPVDHDAPTPLYQQVAAFLRERIAREGLTRLPSLTTIQQEYEVSRPTAESAVKLLVDAGEVTVVPGRGTFVVRKDG
jgi:GntR family transcriptional regulator